jgi:general stress protein YciG
MQSYRLPPGHCIELPGCTLAADTLTLPFPLTLSEAHQLLTLATGDRMRTAKDAAPLLGRSCGWVSHAWRGLGLPSMPRPAFSDPPEPSAEDAAQDPPVARARSSICPQCRQLAELLTTARLCLPVPIRFEEARRRLLLVVLHEVDNDRSRAAQVLGVSRRTIYEWCERYGIPKRRTPPARHVPSAGQAALSSRGFGSRPPEQRRAIARQGGRQLQALGLAHRFTSEEARRAGQQGGLVTSSDREHMAQLGRKGAASRLARLAVGTSTVAPPASRPGTESANPLEMVAGQRSESDCS